MNNMGVQTVLVFLLLFMATVKSDPGVQFWREDFTMTCPGKGTSDTSETSEPSETSKTFEYKQRYNRDTKGLYYCTYGSEPVKYYFYVQGMVCPNCFEVDATWIGAVIVLDVVGTVFVMMAIYRCTKKESPAGPTHASKAPGRSGGRGPPVPSPDYEVGVFMCVCDFLVQSDLAGAQQKSSIMVQSKLFSLLRSQ
uniref:CD3 gamma/delta subunit Ig-like domain-containing protein n=1 Tax=Monopterus albus TaxID=43700 RepID=A0A3Q3KE33_MONAL